MLGAWTDYIKDYWWWVPAIIVFIAVWIFGGGLLLRRSIRRRRPDAKADVPKCLLAISLAGAAGAVSGLIVLLLFRYLGRAVGVNLIVPGVILGAAALLVIGYLSIYAVFTLSAKETLTVCAPPGGAVFVFGLLVFAAAFFPARYFRLRDIARVRARMNIQELAVALEDYQRDLRLATPAPTVQLPETLDELVEHNKITAAKIRPAGADGPPKYFYLLPDGGKLTLEDKTIIACEMRAHHGGRAVLLANTTAEWFSEAEFQERLKPPENRKFAEAFRAAAGN